MFRAIITIAIAITAVTASEYKRENVRTARQFRNIPNTVVSSTYPFYNVLNVNGPGTYAFGYEVFDPHSGNVQFKDEEKLQDGAVRGSYGVLLPNGEVHITRYIADHNGYRSVLEKHRANGFASNVLPIAAPPLADPHRPTVPVFVARPVISQQNIGGPINNSPLPPITPIYYAVGLPNGQHDEIANEGGSQNGIVGWFSNLGNQLPQIFKPITGLFNPQSSQPGPIQSFFNNLSFLGGNQNSNINNAPIVEQFPAGAANDIYEDVPIVRPVAVNTQNIQQVPVIPVPVHPGGNPSTYSNLIRVPLVYGDPHVLPNNRRGFLSNLMSRRRLHHDLNSKIHESNDNDNKELVLVTPATIAA